MYLTLLHFFVQFEERKKKHMFTVQGNLTNIIIHGIKGLKII